MLGEFGRRIEKLKPDVEIIVDHIDHGKRLDVFLSGYIPLKSRSWIQKLVRDSKVYVCKCPVDRCKKVRTGDLIQVFCPNENDELLPDETIDFSVIYEDSDILVINKPAGLAVHPGAGLKDGTLVNGLLHYDKVCFYAMMDDQKRPGIVHRLDKDTTGVMVIAKNNSSKENLIASFKANKVSKTYLAIAHGQLEKSEDRIENYISRHAHFRHKMTVVRKNGKKAISRYKVLSTCKSFSLLKISIETGRTHQIRVHLSNINHPILGDKVYGPPNKHSSIARRQMLHSFVLNFPHPSTGKTCSFRAEVPTDFIEASKEVSLSLDHV